MALREQNRRIHGPAWRVVICVLLIGLVLYNPFAELFHAGHSFSYEKLARNRATVGSSELQQFTPIPDSTDQSIADVCVNSAEPKKTEQVLRGIVQQEASPQVVERLAGVWFRPPPAL